MEENVEIRDGRRINIVIHKHSVNNAVAFLIHGLGGRGDQWREQIEVLKKHYTLIIPDLLGHGKSAKPKPENTNPYRFSEFDLDMQALFDLYAGDKNIVIGHSYGGALAIRLALTYPARIHRLALITPLPCTPSFAIPFLYRLPLPIMQLFRPLLEYKFKQLAFDPNDSPALLAIEQQAMQLNRLYVIKAMVIGMNDIPMSDPSKLDIPTLMISGANDKLVLPTVQTHFYQSLPQHHFQTIPVAAHLPHLEQPSLVNKLLIDFVSPTNVRS